MAGSASDYLENKILDHCLGKAAFAMPTTVAIALCTTVPTDASTGALGANEASYTGYARIAVPAASLNAASGGTTTNSADLTGGNCTAGSSVVVGILLVDSSTVNAGNALYWSDVTSKTIDTSNTPPVIKAGNLTITQS